MSEQARPADYQKRDSELEGMPVGITTYRVGARWICTVDNVSPGAVIARALGSSRDQAEQEALATAASRMASTVRRREALRELREQVQRLDDILEGRR